MGINIPTKEELVANHMKAEQLAQTLGLFSLNAISLVISMIRFRWSSGAASLVYLSVEGLKKSVQSGIKEQLLEKKPDLLEEDLPDMIGHCTACLTGQYPVKLSF